MRKIVASVVLLFGMIASPSHALEGEGVHPDDLKLFSYKGLTLFVDDTPVLHKIASIEGVRDQGYDTIYMGSPIRPPRPITTMTLQEVLNFQDRMVSAGSVSSAVGNYQFIRTTLRDTAKLAGIPLDAPFDRYTQDRLARNLLERCGLYRYDIAEETIANCLAKSWAAIPVASGDKAGRSYYEGIAGNKHRTRVEVIMGTLRGRFKDYRHVHLMRPRGPASSAPVPITNQPPASPQAQQIVETTSPETGAIIFSVSKPGETRSQTVAAIRETLRIRDEMTKDGVYSMPVRKVTLGR